MKEIRIETKLQNKGHYVPGMISGNTLYISGQLPVHHETGLPMTETIEEQTKDALHNVELVLKAAGCAKENVVLCRVYIPDVSHWDTVNEVYGAFFGAHKPARVIVPTRELHNGALVEIEAVAELPGMESGRD